MSRSAICCFIIFVAMPVMPGIIPMPCGIERCSSPGRSRPRSGMCIAVLPSIVNFRSRFVFLLTMSRPQKVKKMCTSTPSLSAALPMMSAG